MATIGPAGEPGRPSWRVLAWRAVRAQQIRPASAQRQKSRSVAVEEGIPELRLPTIRRF
jgi:hypothetical protein